MIPVAQLHHRLLQLLRSRRIGLFQIFPSRGEGRNRRFRLQHVGVESGFRPFVERELVLIPQNPPRNRRPRSVPLAHHVRRILAGIGIPAHRRQKRRRVAILDESRLRIRNLRQLVQRMIPVPFRRGDAPVHGLRPIERRRAPRHRAVVDVINVPVAVGIHHIEHRNRHFRQRLLEFHQIVRLAHFVPFLNRSALFQPRESHRHRLPVLHRDDRAMPGLLQRVLLLLHPRVRLYADRLGPRHGFPVSSVVAVLQRIFRIVESLLPHIHHVRLVHRVAPAEIFVMPDRRKPRAEERRARHIPTLFAMHMALIPLAHSEERLVWIDEQQRVAAGAFGRRDRPHVGPLPFRRVLHVRAPQTCASEQKLVIQRESPERQRMPRLEMLDQPWMDLRILRQIVIQTIGQRVQDRLHPRAGVFVFRLR